MKTLLTWRQGTATPVWRTLQKGEKKRSGFRSGHQRAPVAETRVTLTESEYRKATHYSGISHQFVLPEISKKIKNKKMEAHFGIG